MDHEIDKESFVEFAGFERHLVENGFHGIEFLGEGQFVKDGGVSGVVVIETALLGDDVEDFQGLLRVLFLFDHVDGCVVGDEFGCFRWWD